MAADSWELEMTYKEIHLLEILTVNQTKDIKSCRINVLTHSGFLKEGIGPKYLSRKLWVFLWLPWIKFMFVLVFYFLPGHSQGLHLARLLQIKTKTLVYCYHDSSYELEKFRTAFSEGRIWSSSQLQDKSLFNCVG